MVFHSSICLGSTRRHVAIFFVIASKSQSFMWNYQHAKQLMNFIEDKFEDGGFHQCILKGMLFKNCWLDMTPMTMCAVDFSC